MFCRFLFRLCVTAVMCITNVAYADTDKPATSKTYQMPLVMEDGFSGTDGRDPIPGVMAGTAGTQGLSGDHAVSTASNQITLTNHTTITGGHGGHGGRTGTNNGQGADGAKGGHGILINHHNVTLINQQNASIAAGHSGHGGHATRGNAKGGIGANGQSAVHIQGNYSTIYNKGTIIGGDGGRAGQSVGTGLLQNPSVGGHAIALYGDHATVYNEETGLLKAGQGGHNANAHGQNGAAVYMQGANAQLYNKGTIEGDIIGTEQAQTLYIEKGMIKDGMIHLGGGDDRIIWSGGRVASLIDFGTGHNQLSIQGRVQTDQTIQATDGVVDISVAAQSDFSVYHALQDMGQMTIGANAYMRVYHDTTLPFLKHAGHVWIEQGKTLTLSNYESNQAVWHFHVADHDGQMVTGLLTMPSGVLDLSQDKIMFSVGSVADLPENQSVVFARATDGIRYNSQAIGDNSLLYDFQVTDHGDHLTVSAQRSAGGITQIPELAKQKNLSQLATVLESQIANTNQQIMNLQTRIANVSDTNEMIHVLQSVMPAMDQSTMQTMQAVHTHTQSVTQNRMDQARTGIATGDQSILNQSVWMQPFASKTTQNPRHGSSGYKASIAGVLIGYDRDDLIDRAIIGASFSYADTQTKTLDANRTRGDMTSYHAQIYADYDLGQSVFVQSTIGYGLNHIKRTRFSVGGVAGQDATADYQAHQWTASASLGQYFTPWDKHDLIVIPRMTMRYAYLHTDQFSEQGAGGLNLNVVTDHAQSWVIGGQTDIAYPFYTQKGTLTPSMHIGYHYDLKGDAIDTQATFAGGGTAFHTHGTKPDPHTFNIGAGLGFRTLQGLEVQLQYDAQMKSGYRQHTAFAKLAIPF
jgi:uncharacterized protein with beta-barrel porin domain